MDAGTLTLKDLDLSDRAFHVLSRSDNANTVEKLLKLCVCDIMDIPGIGANCMLNIIDALREKGLDVHECNKASSSWLI